MKILARFLPLLLLVAATGCARPIGSESLKLVDPELSFSMVRERPDDYRGKYLMVGGVIARSANSRHGGELEILQFPLDSSGYPEVTEAPGGRFLAAGDSFLDPLVFRPGLAATLVGEVVGEERRELDGVDYRYPRLRIREIHVWQPGGRTNPILHFGIGIGTVF